MTELAVIAIMAICVASISWTITKEEIFRDLRDFCKEVQKTEQGGFRGWPCKKLAYAPTCDYCLSHWVGFALFALYPVKLVAENWRGYFFAYFATIFLANVLLGLYNIIRVTLRWMRAKADLAEVQLNNAKTPEQNQEVIPNGKPQKQIDRLVA